MQVFATYFGYLCYFPLKHKSEAHEALSLLLPLDDMPPAMIFYDTKESAQGIFNRKLKEASCHLSQTEPVSPWLNVAE